MIALTEQQGQELARAKESPPNVFDPATNTTYVLLRADVFERHPDVGGRRWSGHAASRAPSRAGHARRGRGRSHPGILPTEVRPILMSKRGGRRRGRFSLYRSGKVEGPSRRGGTK